MRFVRNYLRHYTKILHKVELILDNRFLATYSFLVEADKYARENEDDPQNFGLGIELKSTGGALDREKLVRMCEEKAK